MLKRLQLLRCAAFVALFPVCAAADSASATGDSSPAGTVIDADDIRFSEADGKQYFTGNVRISVGDMLLCTDELVLDSAKKSASIPKPLVLDFKDLRFVMESADYDGNARVLRAKFVRGGRGNAFIEGDWIEAAEQRAFIRGGAFYFCEPHWSSISFTTDKLTYDSETDYLYVGTAAFRLAGVPLIPLPPFSVKRFERPPVRLRFNPGENGTAGYFVRTTAHLTCWESFEPGMLLDFYERSGVLAGPALTYDTRGNDSWLSTVGNFQSGYINDTASRGRDRFGQSLNGPRGFIDWTHKQNLAALEFTASIHRWSDSEVMRNFRPSIFNGNQNPDNFFEVVFPTDFYSVSAFTRFQPNDFQNVQQRLPELRFDLRPVELGNTGVYQDFQASYALLREKPSDQRDFALPVGEKYTESSRANIYCGWRRPTKFGGALTLTPVAGVMATHYGLTNGDRGSYTRTLGQIGFDMQATISGTRSLHSDVWNIDGLRHILRPVFQYRYIPDPTQGSDRIPAIDREIYFARPGVIDLSENRAIDELYDEQVFRIGLENIFQTRARGYGSRDLVEFNIYQDLRKSARPGDSRTLSDNFAELVVRPAPWLRLNAFHRMDVYDFSTAALNFSATVTDGDAFSLSLGTTYLRKNPYEDVFGSKKIRQYYAQTNYRLNSQYSVFGAWRFDDLTNVLTDQLYGLRQRLGNSWEIEYSIRYRQNAGSDNNFGIGVSLSLVTF